MQCQLGKVALPLCAPGSFSKGRKKTCLGFLWEHVQMCMWSERGAVQGDRLPSWEHPTSTLPDAAEPVRRTPCDWGCLNKALMACVCSAGPEGVGDVLMVVGLSEDLGD